MEQPAKLISALQPPAIPTKPGGAGEVEKTDANPEEAGTPTAPKKKRRSNWKLYLIVGGGVLFILAIVATNFAPKRPGVNIKVPQIVPTPTTPPRPTVPQFPLGEPSVYSTDPQILQLEGSLKTFERQLDSIDYREQDLDPPVLDMKVEFKLTPTPKPK